MPSEFELIARHFTHRARSAVLGVGDDAALLRAGRGALLAAAADMLVSGRHFAAGADPQRLGHKALAVNLSDMAAMGARPRWALLSIALPRADERWLAAFSRGFMRLARRHGVDLVGGDTTRGPLAINVAVLGEVPPRRALRRDGARPGDDVWVSGTLGGAALALAARRGRVRLPARAAAALGRLLDAPTPRVALGIALRGVARSAIDVSDGLVADLGHLCRRSAVAAVIERARLPLAPSKIVEYKQELAIECALAGGDDYELCFTAPRARRGAVERAAARTRTRVTRIGRIVHAPAAACGVAVLDAHGMPCAPARGGFDHFR
jgi:thiamine-monophosphate kinase